MVRLRRRESIVLSTLGIVSSEMVRLRGRFATGRVQRSSDMVGLGFFTECGDWRHLDVTVPMFLSVEIQHARSAPLRVLLAARRRQLGQVARQQFMPGHTKQRLSGFRFQQDLVAQLVD